MTKSEEKARRADDWAFDMAAGAAMHLPTGLKFVIVPFGTNLDNRARVAQLQENQAHGSTGVYVLPQGVVDRRLAEIEPEDANAPAADRWHVLVDMGLYERAERHLVAQHGPFEAKKRLDAICRAAGERWVFRARLERGWPDGRRAV